MATDGTTRMTELALAAVAAVVFAPVVAILALLVRLDSPGPVLHRETRLGRAGRPFRITKLRTLHADAERRPLVAPIGDPRITRVGRLLRPMHLDELPQLLHVLAGTMSLVGPRPKPPELWSHTSPRLRGRALAFRPGMTSPGGLRYLCEDTVLGAFPDPEPLYREVLLPMKVAEDVRYLESRTPASDLGVLLRTAARVFVAPDDTDCRRELHALLAAHVHRNRAT